MNVNQRTVSGHENGFEPSAQNVARPQLGPMSQTNAENSATKPQDLGEPLSIRDVAQLLGCSAWTVRQRYLPQGLPHLRACSGGRIVFFREQVIAWILKRQQQKGGLRK